MTERNENGNNVLICGQFRILAELGKSPAGVVYKCLDESSGNIVALKRLPVEVARDEEEMQGITENIHLYYKLNHQNIAACHALIHDQNNNDYYFVTDYVDGITLTEWVRRNREGRTVPQHLIVPIVKQLADALDYAHSQQIVHRDLKPENIMIEADGNVRILDCGLSAQIRDSLARLMPENGEYRGNPPYVAPEQWRENKIYANSDQYALGILVYELLAGELPFKCTRQTSPNIVKELTITEEPERIDTVVKPVWDAIYRAIKKNPAERHAMCKSFSFVLEQWLKPPVPVQEEEVAVPRKINRGLLLPVLITAILGGAAGYFFFGIIGAAAGVAAGIMIGFLIGILKG